MDTQRSALEVSVWAPAKLNLSFEVLGKRDDGFHEIETLMVPVSLYDHLVLRTRSDGSIRLHCRWAGRHDERVFGELPAAEENLATRAVELLKRKAGVEQGASIELIKRIPPAAGMGGGSSDAAAALVAANAAWKLGWTIERLASLSAELGSDVPFFFARQSAICRGRGERVEPVGRLGVMYFVVVRPPQGLSTAHVYAACHASSAPQSAVPLVDALRRGDYRQSARLMKNQLEPAAESMTPWIRRLRGEFAQVGCIGAGMSGSGSSYFGVCRHARHARRVAGRLQLRGIGRVYAVRS